MVLLISFGLNIDLESKITTACIGIEVKRSGIVATLQSCTATKQSVYTSDTNLLFSKKDYT